MGNFSCKLHRILLSLHSFNVTLLILGFRLFFILLQINKPRVTIVTQKLQQITTNVSSLEFTFGFIVGLTVGFTVSIISQFSTAKTVVLIRGLKTKVVKSKNAERGRRGC